MFQQINPTTLINISKIEAISTVYDKVTITIGGRDYESFLSENDVKKLVEEYQLDYLKEIQKKIIWQTTSASQFGG